MIKYLENNNLDELIGDGVYLVDFYADWCGPCKMLGPVMETVSGKITDVNFYKVNVDESEEVAAKYGIMSIPAVFMFKNGKPIAKTVGFMPEEDLTSWVNNNK